ncbi:hypothetical protein ACWEL8_28495 [Streptomyces sp. NPDC004690]
MKRERATRLLADMITLGRPVGEMGDTARGAGRTGASHAMTVNEAVLALLCPKPDLAQLTGEPADVRAAAQAAFDRRHRAGRGSCGTSTAAAHRRSGDRGGPPHG